MIKNAGGKIAIFAFDTANNAPKTGDAANLTAYVSKDGGAPAALADATASELDAVNAPGVYVFDVTAGESNADLLVFTGKSVTANIQIDPVFHYPIDNAVVTAVKAKTDNLPPDPADASDLAALLATIIGYIDTEVAAIKAKTDLIPAAGPASAADYTAGRAAKLDHLDVDVSTRAAATTAGNGALIVTVTVTDGAAPLQNATVRLTEGANSFAVLTDVNGVASFSLDPALYNIAITKPGYTFAPGTINVAAAGNFNKAMAAVVIAAPADPDQATGAITTRDGQGNAQPNVPIYFRLKAAPGTDSYRTEQFLVKSNGAGLLTAAFRKGATYQAKRSFEFKLPDAKPAWVEFVVPNAGAFALPQILGTP